MTEIDGGSQSNTSEIRLRSPRTEDANVSFSWRDDRSLQAATLGRPFPTTLDREISWLGNFGEDAFPTSLLYSIEHLETQDLMGYVSLRNIDWITRTAEFGIYIGSPKSRGLGYGRDATKQMLAIAFAQYNLSRVWLHVVETNTTATALYRDLGFTLEGTLRSHAFNNGKHYDVGVMGLLKKDFRHNAD